MSYQVKIISTEDRGTEDKGISEKTVTSDTNSVTVDGLECGSSYVAFVTPFAVDRAGPGSRVLHFRICKCILVCHVYIIYYSSWHYDIDIATLLTFYIICGFFIIYSYISFKYTLRTH